MALLKSGIDLFAELGLIVRNSQNLVLIAPYIKRPVLKNLLELRRDEALCTVLTTWKPRDVKFGATDLDCYEVCRSYGIPLLINNRIHIKAYFDYGRDGIIGSANLTETALGLTEPFNYEVAQKIELAEIDNVYFDQIIAESFPVTDEIFADILRQVEAMKDGDALPKDFSIEVPQDHFLLSALPQTDNPDSLYRLYSGKTKGTPREKACAAADIFRYKISAGLTEKNFMNELRTTFFAHPFIIAFLSYNDSFVRGGLRGRQFGDLRAWIQSRTTQVPTPRRFEINDPLNHLYDWVVALGKGLYEKIQPGTHTWVLRSHSKSALNAASQ